MSLKGPGTFAKFWRFLSLVIICTVSLFIWMLWYGVNSDYDNIHPILAHLIPAGNAICSSATVFECSACLTAPHEVTTTPTNPGTWQYEYGRDDRNEGLQDNQCQAAFPGLFEDVDRALRHWHNTSSRIDAATLDAIPLQNSMTRAMIHNGILYVIATKSKGEDHRRKTVAVLSSMHRALIAAQDRHTIPDIEFTFSIEDKATDLTSTSDQPLWVLARKASEESFFLLPDFGFWAWDNIVRPNTPSSTTPTPKTANNEIGTYDEIVSQALALESSLSFPQKAPELIWRGKLSFAPKLRRALLDASRGERWDNVKEVHWDTHENALSMSDHCRYQFIAHVEGRSYSASLKYRQACRSVIVAHKLQYVQHHHYLLNNGARDSSLQNYVEVERDFSDLPSKMAALLHDPTRAAQIADNSVRTFRERYLTPAAEACYWRHLWRGYGQISAPSRLWKDDADGAGHDASDSSSSPSPPLLGPVETSRSRAMRYETFLLLSSTEMLDFSFV